MARGAAGSAAHAELRGDFGGDDVLLGSDGQVLGKRRLCSTTKVRQSFRFRCAEPTYASLGGEPMLLTKNETGALLLPLSQGEQSVSLQHRQSFQRTNGLGFGSLWLPELAAPAASAQIELRYDRDWLPIYESLSPEVRFPSLSFGELFVLGVLLIVAERLLLALGLLRLLRLSIALCLGIAAATGEHVYGAAVRDRDGDRWTLHFAVAVWSKAAVWLVVGGLCIGGLWGC